MTMTNNVSNNDKNPNNFHFFSDIMDKTVELFIFANKSKFPSAINEKFTNTFPAQLKDLKLNYVLVLTKDIEYGITLVTLDISAEDTIKYKPYLDYKMFYPEERNKLLIYCSNVNKIFDKTERNILMIRKK